MKQGSILCFFALFILKTTVLQGQIQRDTIYINRGIFTSVDTVSFPYLAFNKSTDFVTENVVVKINAGDSLVLTVINNDTAIHGFALKGTSKKALTIAPGSSQILGIKARELGIICFYDPLNYPVNRYMGLAGMICVDDFGNKNVHRFYWNLKEHDSLFNRNIVLGNAVDFSNYYPNYFTINGKSFPDLQKDSTAAILGKVGDTIRIFCLNSGQSSHSIHFHGFHTRAIYHSQTAKKDWEKDTWGTPSMEFMILEFVPDKPGRYSVHDHNLVAVSGGGVHPNGMFMIMNIQ